MAECIRKLRQGIGHGDIPSLSLLGWKQLLQPLFGYFNERLRRSRPIRMYQQCKRSIRANAKHDESSALAIQDRPNFVERSWSAKSAPRSVNCCRNSWHLPASAKSKAASGLPAPTLSAAALSQSIASASTRSRQASIHE